MADTHVRADLQYRSVFSRKSEVRVEGNYVRGVNAPLPPESDDSCLPEKADDATTAKYFTRVFVEPYRVKNAGFRGLAAKQRDYLAYRLLLDIGRVKRRGCNVGQQCFEAAILFVSWIGYRKHAEDLFAMMSDDGVLPTQRAYDGLLSTFARRGDLENFAKYRKEMRRRGYPPTRFTYTNAIFALSMNAKLADLESGPLVGVRDPSATPAPSPEAKAHKIYVAMVNDGVDPDKTTFKALMDTCRSYRSGMRVMGLLGRHNLRADPTLRRGLMEACRWRGEVAHAKVLYQELVADGHHDAVTLNGYLTVLRRGAALPVALAAVEQYTRRGAQPTAVTYSLLLEVIAAEICLKRSSAHAPPATAGGSGLTEEYRASLLKLADGLFEQALLGGHAQARFVYNGMAAVYAAADDAGALERLEERQVREGIPVSGIFKRYLLAVADGKAGVVAAADGSGETHRATGTHNTTAALDDVSDEVAALSRDVELLRRDAEAAVPGGGGDAPRATAGGGNRAHTGTSGTRVHRAGGNVSGTPQHAQAELTRLLGDMAGIPEEHIPPQPEPDPVVHIPQPVPRRSVSNILSEGVRTAAGARGVPRGGSAAVLPAAQHTPKKKLPDRVYRKQLLKLVKDVLQRGA